MSKMSRIDALVKVAPAAIERLDELAGQSGMLAIETSPFRKAITTASIMQEIRGALQAPGVMDCIMALQGTPIGFKADKQYPVATVVDAVIAASIRGLPVVGNCFNIIAGNCYVTKEGMQYLLRQLKHLTYRLTPGIPKSANGGAICPMDIEWIFNGADGKQHLELCVRVNAGMGADAIIGKATRKALAWLYAYLTGSEMPDGDADDREITVAATSTPEKPAPKGSDRLASKIGMTHASQTAGNLMDCSGEPDDETLFHLEQEASAAPIAGHAE